MNKNNDNNNNNDKNKNNNNKNNNNKEQQQQQKQQQQQQQQQQPYQHQRLVTGPGYRLAPRQQSDASTAQQSKQARPSTPLTLTLSLQHRSLLLSAQLMVNNSLLPSQKAKVGPDLEPKPYMLTLYSMHSHTTDG